MSLDIYLSDPTATYEAATLFESNITHNLNTMAEKAGLYDPLWRPYRIIAKAENVILHESDHEAEYEYEEFSRVTSNDIVDLVQKGLDKLKSDPEYFKKYNAPNGWGVYENLVEFTEEYLKALKEYPEAIIQVSR